MIEKIYDEIPDGHRIPKKEELATNGANENLDGFGSATYGEIVPSAVKHVINLLMIDGKNL